MKFPHGAEILERNTGMETDKVEARSSGPGSKAPGKNRSRPSSSQIAASKFGAGPVPLEWMDGSSWRLPSGKALAEFALQAGFLAPLMLKMPRISGSSKKGKNS